MAYRRTDTAADLPVQAGATPAPVPEDLRFDMKMAVSNQIGDQGDQACDMAAFANAMGGVLLVGAHEHPRNSGILHAYVPVDQAEAQQICESYEQALSLCSPRPVIDAKPVELVVGQGRYVVVVNCEPYAAPPIGVAQPGQGGGEKWWAFPARRGNDNHPLRPEELATIMEPRLRRIALQLERLPVRNPTFYFSNNEWRNLRIVEIEHEASAVRLETTDRTNASSLMLPLDAIEMIWRDDSLGRDGMWKVAVRCRLVEDGNRPALAYWITKEH
jgi:hypothetical protein